MSHINNQPHQHHGGRSRRAHRQVKAVRTKEVVESVNITNFRRDFESARGFDFEDDEIFCPFNLFTEDDVSRIHQKKLQEEQEKQAQAQAQEAKKLQAQQNKQYYQQFLPPGFGSWSELAYCVPIEGQTLPWIPPEFLHEFNCAFPPAFTLTPPPDAPAPTYFPNQLQSISSSASDRSSLSSGSPEQSPLQHQLQPTPQFVLSSASNFTPSTYQQSTTTTTKIHQPLAQRQLKAIPIVDPTTRAVASPPPSVSPARQMQQQHMMNRRGW